MLSNSRFFFLFTLDFCIDVGRNLCHGSDSVDNAEKEIALWFPHGVVSHQRVMEKLIYE